MKNSIKLAIADDDHIFRDIFKIFIKQFENIELIIEVSNGKDLIDAMQNGKKPDVILLDVEMPLVNGIETMEYLSKGKLLKTKVLILTMHNNDELFNYLIELGANGFVPKDIGFPKIIESVFDVQKTGYYFSQVDLRRIIVAKKSGIIKPVTLEEVIFSKRELEIIQLIFQQYSNEEISKKLCISKRTVDGHRSNLLQKTNSSNSIGLILFSLRNNLINKELYI